MISNKSWITKAVLLAALSYPLSSQAETFTSKTVLEWSQEGQDALFQNSVVMMGIVAAQDGRHKAISECIDKFYASSAESRRKSNDMLREALAKFPNHHPQTVIFAVVQKRCGSFKD